MNKDLAIKISKHPMIKRLMESVDKKDVARLIAEELMEAERDTLRGTLSRLLKKGKPKDRKKIIVDFFTILKTGKGYEKILKTWPKMPDEKKQAFIEAGKKFDITKGRAKEFTKEIIAATTPQEVEAKVEDLVDDVEEQTGVNLDTGEAPQGEETAEKETTGLVKKIDNLGIKDEEGRQFFIAETTKYGNIPYYSSSGTGGVSGKGEMTPFVGIGYLSTETPIWLIKFQGSTRTGPDGITFEKTPRDKNTSPQDLDFKKIRDSFAKKINENEKNIVTTKKELRNLKRKFDRSSVPYKVLGIVEYYIGQIRFYAKLNRIYDALGAINKDFMRGKKYDLWGIDDVKIKGEDEQVYAVISKDFQGFSGESSQSKKTDSPEKEDSTKTTDSDITDTEQPKGEETDEEERNVPPPNPFGDDTTPTESSPYESFLEKIKNAKTKEQLEAIRDELLSYANTNKGKIDVSQATTLQKAFNQKNNEITPEPETTQKTKDTGTFTKFSPKSKTRKSIERDKLFTSIWSAKEDDRIKSIIQKIADVYKQFIGDSLKENKGVDRINTALNAIGDVSQFETIGKALGLSGENLENFSKQAPRQDYNEGEANILLVILELVQFEEYRELLDYIKDSVLSIVKPEEKEEPEEEETKVSPEKDKEDKPDSDTTDTEQPEGEKETRPSAEPEKLDVDDDTAKEYIKAVEELQNDFYRKRYKIQQAKIIKSVIDAIAKIAGQEGKELSYQPVPKEKPEGEGEALQEGKEITADDKEIKDLRIAFRSFLSLVNKTKKALAKFEDEAGRGSVLARSSKKDFMNLLKRLQDTIAKLVGSIKQILDTPEEQLQEVTKEEMLNRWKEVQEAYDKTIDANSALKELLKGEGEASYDPDDIVNLAYSTALNLSQYFPSVNPFNKGAQSKADLTKYKDTFQSAIDDVKESLQYVVNIATRGVVNASSLAESSAALQEFSEKIKDIFGVEGPMSGPYNPKSEPAAEGESKQPDSEEEPLVYNDEGATLSEKQREVLDKFLNILSKDSLMNENIQKLKDLIGSDKTIQYMENSVMKAYNKMEESERPILDEMLENEEILKNIMETIRNKYTLKSRFAQQIKERSADQIANILAAQFNPNDVENAHRKIAIVIGAIKSLDGKDKKGKEIKGFYTKKSSEIYSNIQKKDRFLHNKNDIAIALATLQNIRSDIYNDLMGTVLKKLEDSPELEQINDTLADALRLADIPEEKRKPILDAVHDEEPAMADKLEKATDEIVAGITRAEGDSSARFAEIYKMAMELPEDQIDISLDASANVLKSMISDGDIDSKKQKEIEETIQAIENDLEEERKEAKTSEDKKEVEEKKGFFKRMIDALGSVFSGLFGGEKEEEELDKEEEEEKASPEGSPDGSPDGSPEGSPDGSPEGELASPEDRAPEEEEKKLYYYNDKREYVRSSAGEFHKTEAEIRKQIEKELKDSPKIRHWIYVPDLEEFIQLPNDEYLPQFSDLFDSSVKPEEKSDPIEDEDDFPLTLPEEGERTAAIQGKNDQIAESAGITDKKLILAGNYFLVNLMNKMYSDDKLEENETIPDKVKQKTGEKLYRYMFKKMSDPKVDRWRSFKKYLEELNKANKLNDYLNYLDRLIKGAPSAVKKKSEVDLSPLTQGVKDNIEKIKKTQKIAQKAAKKRPISEELKQQINDAYKERKNELEAPDSTDLDYRQIFDRLVAYFYNEVSEHNPDSSKWESLFLTGVQQIIQYMIDDKETLAELKAEIDEHEQEQKSFKKSLEELDPEIKEKFQRLIDRIDEINARLDEISTALGDLPYGEEYEEEYEKLDQEGGELAAELEELEQEIGPETEDEKDKYLQIEESLAELSGILKEKNEAFEKAVKGFYQGIIDKGTIVKNFKGNVRDNFEEQIANKLKPLIKEMLRRN